MTGRTIRYYIAAPDAMEAIRTAWDAQLRSFGDNPELAERREDIPARLRKNHVYRVRIPTEQDGRVPLLGTAEEVAE